MPARKISTVVDKRFQVGEGPLWDERNQTFMWTSITEGIIHSLRPTTGQTQSWSFLSTVGAFGLCDNGKFIVALRDTVVIFDPLTGRSDTIAAIKHAIPEMRLNDGKVGPDGAFWVGSLDDRAVKEPIGALYRIDASGSVREITAGLKVSNGLAWSPDGRTMYHSDTRGPWIDCWDFDPATGEVTNRRPFARPDDATGRPDGGACDMDGYYWSAGPSASRVNRFSPDGQLVETVDLPNFRPTMPCFGGEDLKTVYVTSLSSGVSDELLKTHPLCGGIVSFDVAVAGVPVARFRTSASQ